MTEWYIYEDQEVHGPFEYDNLCEKIGPKTLVCPAGTENWEQAGKLEQLAGCFESQTAATPTPKNEAESTARPEVLPEPTLEALRTICQHATSADLQRQYREFWDSYDRQEQRIIRNELGNRGDWDELVEDD